MDDLTHRELAGRRPAEVIPHKRIMVAPRHGRHQMIAAARKAAERGEIRILASRATWSEQWEQWELPVQQLYRRPVPWWRTRWFAICAVLSVLGSLAGLGYWVLSSLAAAPLALFCVAVIFGLAALLRAGRRPRVIVTQRVEIG